MLSWQVEKSSPKISPDFSHRKFQISNRISNQISPKISQTHFCKRGSPNHSSYHLQGPQPGFPKTAAATAAETAGETRGAGGTAAETAGGTALALRRRETAHSAIPPAVSAAVPPAPRVFPSISAEVSAAVLWTPGLGAL